MFYSFQSFGKRFYFCCNRYSSLSKVEGAWQESVLRHQQQHQAQEGVQGQVRQAGFWWRNGQLVGSETLTAVQDEIIGTAYLAAAYLEEVTEQTNKQTKLNNRVFHFSSLKRKSQKDLAYNATIYSKTFAAKI